MTTLLHAPSAQSIVLEGVDWDYYEQTLASLMDSHVRVTYIHTPPPPLTRHLPDTTTPPDLAIEVEITSGSIPRQPIYSALGIPEIWRYEDHAIIILLRQPDGGYAPARQSAAFPKLPMDVFNRHLRMALATTQHAAVRAFRDWVRPSL